MHSMSMSFLSYMVLIVWAVLQTSSSHFTSVGPAIRSTSIPKSTLRPKCSPLCPSTLPRPHCNPESGSIFAKDPCVKTFTRRCLKDAFKAGILREALDFSQTTVKQYADFLRENSKQYLLSFGVEDDNAAALGEFTARNLKEQNFKCLTLPIVARAFCNSAVNMLFVTGILTLKNVEDLGRSFTKALADSVNATMNSDPTSKFPALTNGFATFFDSLGLLSKKNAQLIAYFIGTEWFVAALNYRCSE